MEDAAKVLMLVNEAGVEYYVINVGLRKRAAGSKKIIHGTLNSTGSIAQHKMRDFELVRAEFILGSRTRNMFRVHSSLVIGSRSMR